LPGLGFFGRWTITPRKQLFSEEVVKIVARFIRNDSDALTLREARAITIRDSFFRRILDVHYIIAFWHLIDCREKRGSASVITRIWETTTAGCGVKAKATGGWNCIHD
jgi:hypothetical protein